MFDQMQKKPLKKSQSMGHYNKPNFASTLNGVSTDAPCIQRKINSVDVDTQSVTRDRTRLGVPINVSVSHDNNDSERIEVTRLVRAVNMKSDKPLGAPKRKEYSVTPGGDTVNSFSQYSPDEKTIDDAEWQNDGPHEGNVTREENSVLVKDSPGFAFLYDEMFPVSHHSEFKFTAKDLDVVEGEADAEQTIEFSASFTEEEAQEAWAAGATD